METIEDLAKSPVPKRMSHQFNRRFQFRLKDAFIVFLIIGLFAASYRFYSTSFQSRTAAVVADDGRIGFVLPPHAIDPKMFNAEKAWVPTMPQISEAEHCIHLYAKSHPSPVIEGCIRQYAGVIRNGRRFVICNFVRDENFLDGENISVEHALMQLANSWYQEWDDAPDWVFSFEYDTESKACELR